jgi:hypothetical protein
VSPDEPSDEEDYGQPSASPRSKQPPAAPGASSDDDIASSDNDIHDVLRSGWGGSKAIMDSTSAWAQNFRPEEDSQIIAFAQDEPYVGYRRHWVDRQTKDGKSTRSYVCLQTVGKECPLCEAGIRPQAVSAFNIFLLDTKGDVSLKSWDVGARLFGVLKAYANDPKIGPLTKGFFLVNKSGQKQSTQYNVNPIKRTALEEDYNTPVPDEVTLKQLKLYDKSILQIPTVKEMREIADEMMDDYDE